MILKKALTCLVFYLLLCTGISRAAQVVHTTQNDFSSGTFTGWGADVTNTGGGDVRLAFGGAEIIPGFSSSTVLPQIMRNHAAAVWNARIYISGGVTSGGVLVYSAPINSDGSLGSWVSESSLPAQRTLHTMTAWNGRLYVVGGFGGGVPQATIFSAPINSNGMVGAWVTESNGLPFGRYRHATTVWNGRMYVTGGDNTSFVKQSTVFSAPLNADGSVGTWRTETNSMPDINAYHDMQVNNNRLYVTGGLDPSDNPRNIVWSAPINADSTVGIWISETNVLPLARYNHKAAVVNGKLIIAGGYNAGGSSTVFTASFNSDASVGNWISEVVSLPEVRYQHTMSSWNGRIFIVGGLNFNTDRVYVAPINGAGRESTENTEANAMPGTKREHGMVSWNGRIYVAGGLDSSSNPQSSVFSAPINSDGTVGGWGSENSLPYGPAGVTLGAWNGRMYAVGGRSQLSCSGATFFSSVYSAPINSNGSIGTWVAENSLPAGRASHGMTIVAGRIYIIAGANPCSSNSTVYSAAITNGTVGTWRTETGYPDTVQGLSVTAWNGRIYGSGGVNSGGNSVASVYSAPINFPDGTVGTWRSETGMPADRRYHVLLASNGRLIAAYGGTNAAGINSPASYQPYVATISPVDGTLSAWGNESISLFTGRNAPASAIWNGKVYTTGGHFSPGNTRNFVMSTQFQYYSTSGTFFSPIVDLGGERNIDSLAWTIGATPPNSNLSVFIATSIQPTGPLTSFIPVSNGSVFNAIARYLQYRFTMNPGGNPQTNTPTGYQTPVVNDVTVTHNPDIVNPNRAPVLNAIDVSSVSVSSITITYLDRSLGETHFRISTGSVSGPSNDAYVYVSTLNSLGSTIVSTLTALIPNTSYFIRIRGFNALENVSGAFSNELSTATLAAIPVLNSPNWSNADVGMSSITARWNANGNPSDTRYHVEIGSDSLFTGSITSSDTFTLSVTTSGLLPNTTLYFRVQAINRLSLPTAFAIFAGTETVAPVPSLNNPNWATGDVNTSPQLARWNANGNTAGTTYQVQFATSGDFNSLGITLTPGLGGSEFTTSVSIATGTPRNWFLAFRVRATYPGRDPSDWNVSNTTASLADPPILSGFSVVDGTVSATISPGINPVGTLIKISTGNFDTGSSSAGIQALPTITLTMMFNNVNTSYTVLARAENYFGRPTSNVTVVSSATKALVPGIPNVFTNVEAASMTVTWATNGNPVSPPTLYELRYSTVSNFLSGTTLSSQTINGCCNVSTLIPGLFGNTPYSFRARAINRMGVPTDLTVITSTKTHPAVPALNSTHWATADVSMTTVTARWQANTNAPGTMYQVEFATSSDFTSPGLAISQFDTASLNISSNVPAGWTIAFRVRASDNGSWPTPYVTSVATGSLVTLPALSASSWDPLDIGITSVTARWSDNGNSSGTVYRVQFATSTDFTSVTEFTTTNIYISSSVTSNWTIAFRVRAENPNNLPSEYVASVATTTFTFAPVLTGFQVFTTSISVTLAPNANPPGTAVMITTGDFSVSNSSNSSFGSGNITLKSLSLVPNTGYTLQARTLNNNNIPSSAIPIASTTTLTAVHAIAGFQVFATSVAITIGANGNPQGTQITVSTGLAGYFGVDLSTIGFISGTNTTLVISGLTPNTTYGFQSGSLNPTGSTNTIVITASTRTLSAMHSISGFQIFTTSVAITIGANGNPSGTKIFVSTGTDGNFSVLSSSRGVVSGSDTSLSIFGLSTNTAYSFQSGSLNADGSTNPVIVTGSTYTLVVPPIPTDFAFSTNSIAVTLDLNSNPFGTLLEISTANFTVGSSSAGAVTSLILGSLTPNTTYLIRVRAINGTGSASASVFVVSSGTLSNPPGDISFPKVNLSSVTFSWAPNGNPLSPPTSYQVQVSSIADFSSNIMSNITFALSSTTINLQPSTSYYFRASVFNRSGGQSDFGVTAVTATLPGVPLLNSPNWANADVGINNVVAKWTANGNAPGTLYRVQFATSSDFTSPGITLTQASTTGLSVSSAVTANWTTAFRVQAQNFNGIAGNFATSVATVTLVRVPVLSSFRVFTTSIAVSLASNGNPPGTAILGSTGAFSVNNSSAGVQDVADTTLVLSNLTPNTIYSVQTRAANYNGLNSSVSIVIASTITQTSLHSVTSFRVFTTSVSVTIGANSNPPGTQIFVSTGTQGDFTVDNSSIGIIGGNNTTLTLLDLSTNTLYGIQSGSLAVDGSSKTIVVTGSTATLSAIPAVTDVAFSTNKVTVNLDLNSNPINTALEISTSNFTAGSSSAGAVTALTIQDLIPNTTYSIRARSVNVNGSASPGVLVISSATQANVPGAVILTEVNLTSITVSWSPNGNPLTKPTSYQIQVSQDPSFGSFTSSITFVLSLSTAGLISNSNYYFRVRAFNRNGVPSDFNTVTAAFTGARPLIVSGFQVFVTSVAISVNRNGNGIGSAIMVSTGTDSNFAVTLSSQGFISGDDTTLTVLHLSTNTSYSLQAGIESGGVPIKTDVTASTVTLSAPPQITDILSTHNSIAVNLDPGTNPQGTILEISTDNFVSSASGVGPAFGFGSLTPNSPYTIMARSINQNGSPSPSALVSTYTRAALPDNLQNTQATLTSLEFSWDPNGNPFGTQYFTELYLGQQAELLRSQTGAGTSITYSGLAIGTRYTLYLRALNQDGSPGSIVSLSTQTRNTTPPDPKISVTTSSYVLSWNFQPDGQGYRVRDQTGKLLAELSSATVVFSEDNFLENQKIVRQMEYFNQFISTPIFTMTFYTTITPPKASADVITILDKGSTWIKIRVTAPPNPQDGKTAVRIRLVPVGRGLTAASLYRVSGIFAADPAQTILSDFTYPEWEKTIDGLVPGTQYSIQVSYVNADGIESPAGSITLDVFVGFNAGEEGIKVANETFFINQGVDFIVSSNQSGSGSIRIYGVEQNLVRSIPFNYGPGITPVRWDGKDDNGESVFTDIYWVVIESQQFGKKKAYVAAIR